MNHVTGIGGVFFRAENPDLLAKWYLHNLGITPVPAEYGKEPWQQQAGPTVFAPFEKETEYFGNPSRQWMINFRVRDLDGLIKALQSRQIEVKLDPEAYPNGRFARLHDPEGNPIELWEPK